MKLISQETIDIIYVQYDSTDERDKDITEKERQGWEVCRRFTISDDERWRKLIVRYVKGNIGHIL
jgi:hypothetical protein